MRIYTHENQLRHKNFFRRLSKIGVHGHGPIWSSEEIDSRYAAPGGLPILVPFWKSTE